MMRDKMLRKSLKRTSNAKLSQLLIIMNIRKPKTTKNPERSWMTILEQRQTTQVFRAFNGTLVLEGWKLLLKNAYKIKSLFCLLVKQDVARLLFAS